MSEAKDLHAENVSLAEQIASLRSAFELDKARDVADRATAEAVFKSFDVNNDGTLQTAYLELLAFECGLDSSVFYRDETQDAFNSLGLADAGKFSLEEFISWFETARNLPPRDDVVYIDLLKVRLYAQVWYSLFQAVKAHLEKNPAKSSEVDVSGHTDTPVTVKVSAGEFEARSGLYITGSQNDEEAEELRDEVECPEEVDIFFFVDIGLKEGVDEMDVGELCGMIEVVLDALPFDKLPLPVYHSHTVDVAEDENEVQRIRITFFSTPRYQEFVDKFLGSGTTLPDSWLSFSSKLELPYALSDFTENLDKAMELEKVGFNLEAETILNPIIISKAIQMAERLPTHLSYRVKQNVAFYEWLQKCSVRVEAGSVLELANQLPETVNTPAAQLKTQLQDIGRIAVGKTLKKLFEPLASLADTQKELFSKLKETATGMDRVHMQVHNISVNVDIKGFPLVPFLP